MRPLPLLAATLAGAVSAWAPGRADAQSLRAAGYDAVLVGETLVTADDPAAALTDLIV